MAELLTDEQQAVVRHAGSAFVNACPGSGKTFTLVERFAIRRQRLSRHQGIAVVSFTNSAADKLRKKIAARCGNTGVEHPNFVGTFDQFINRYLVSPFSTPWREGRMEVLDTWDRINVNEIRPRGVGNIPRGLRLDDLEVDEHNSLIWDVDDLSDPALKALIRQNEGPWKAEATRRRAGLLKAGYMTCKESRNLTLANIRNPRIGDALARAFPSRFAEILVDEAQDCNVNELVILRWIRDAGIPMVLVADVNQCIYEFRDARPDQLVAFASDLPTFSLTSNFRSSQAICGFAKTLKMHGHRIADEATNTDPQSPVQIIPYETLDTHVHDIHKASCERLGIQSVDRSVLAHVRANAYRVAGRFLPDRSTTQSPSVLLASAVQHYQLSNDASSKFEAVTIVEGLILRVLGAETTGSSKRLSAELGLEYEWLRMTAVSILSSMPSLQNTDSATWLLTARQLFGNIQIPNGLKPASTPGQVFRTSAAYSSAIQQIIPEIGVVSTIHGVKGLEYEAVLLIIPNFGRTKINIGDWEGQCGDLEALRVLYVAATRAKKLLSVAIHEANLNRLKSILDDGEVDYVVCPVQA